jgi:hypothetical protein
MRAKNNATNAPTGAIGGMFSWISQPWLPPMYGQDEMNTILTEWRPGYKHTLGGASVNGNQYVLDMCPGDAGDTHNSWILLGDPSMMVRTDVPQSMGVTASPSTLVVGMSSLTVQADTEYGIATLSKGNEVITSAHIENGNAKLEFPALTGVDQLTLVVIGYNKVTEVKTIEVVPADGAFVIFDSYDINQEDGQVDYNEVINLTLKLKNVGNDAANNVTVELTSESEHVVINKGTATVSTIGGNEVATLDKAFEIFVNPSAPHGEKINFVVKCSDGTSTWETEFKLVANAPVLNLNKVECSDDEILPGETFTLSMTFNNEGGSAAYDILTELWENAPDITISEKAIETASVEAGESFTVTTDITVSSSLEIGSIYEIPFAVSAGYNTFSSKYELVIGKVTEDFETGDLSSYNWILEGDSQWHIDNQQAYEGTYSVKSGVIGDNGITKLRLQIEVISAGELSFYKKISTEESYDIVSFLIDNVVVGEWSGESNWTYTSFELTQGSHLIEWRFAKDYMLGGGSDCCWIDMIAFPPVKHINVLNAVENLSATMNANAVTLTWDALSGADEYIIRRNGEEVATQTETTFTETLAEGIYTYNIVARNGNKYSMPAFITVNTNAISVDEIVTEHVSVYPNPTSGILNVDINENFNAVIYNYQGQVVMKTYVNNGQIDMSQLVSGIYFVEIRTNNSVSVEKVIVK